MESHEQVTEAAAAIRPIGLRYVDQMCVLGRELEIVAIHLRAGVIINCGAPALVA